MNLLFVDACPRAAESRTLALAEHLLARLKGAVPGLSVRTHCLRAMGLRGIDAGGLARREALCDRRAWEEEGLPAEDAALLRTGLDFQRADALVIAAPYWDLSFPSVLKTWTENIWIRNLTFVYRHDKPVGLARGKAAVYVTTAGSFTAGHDWGTLYVRDVLRTLGVPAFRDVKAEGLDLDGADPEAILSLARTRAEEAADWLRDRLAAPDASLPAPDPIYPEERL